jgi:hypothetical protein
MMWTLKATRSDFPCTGISGVVRALANRFAALLNASGLAMATPGAPASSMITAFILLDPIAAPGPPRPALRMFPSGSAKGMLAAVSLISPARPTMATPALALYFAWSTLMAS